MPPRPGVGDKYHSLVKAALAAIPGIGGSAAEIFAMLVYPPLAKRQQEWMDAIADVVVELQRERKTRLEDLQNDPDFVDALVLATQVAVRTGVADKLTALRNAVRNSGSPGRLDGARQQMFIRLIDEFTEWHLRLLKLFDDPIAWFGSKNQEVPKGNMRDVISQAYAELDSRGEFVSLIWRDLYVRSLVESERALNDIYDFRATLDRGGTERMEQLTPMGKEFLRFVESG